MPSLLGNVGFIKDVDDGADRNRSVGRQKLAKHAFLFFPIDQRIINAHGYIIALGQLCRQFDSLRFDAIVSFSQSGAVDKAEKPSLVREIFFQ